MGEKLLQRHAEMDRSIATILKRFSPVTYIVKWPDGSTDKRHLNQIVKREINNSGINNDTKESKVPIRPTVLRRSERLQTKK